MISLELRANAISKQEGGATSNNCCADSCCLAVQMHSMWCALIPAHPIPLLVCLLMVPGNLHK